MVYVYSKIETIVQWHSPSIMKWDSSFIVRGHTQLFYWKYLSECANGNPSNVQDRVGVGVPLAIHFSEALGPGPIVWLINLYSSSGGEARYLTKKNSICNYTVIKLLKCKFSCKRT